WSAASELLTTHKGALESGGTRSAAVDPRLDQLAEQLLRPRHRIAILAWMPAKGDEIVLGHVLVQQREVAAAGALGVLQLLTDLSDRLALPGHLDRCQSPTGMSRNALIR